MSDFGHIDVLQLKELLNRFQAILEGENCACDYVAKLLCQDRLLASDILVEFVPELKTLVNLHSGLYLGSNRRNR